jgi:putative ABC transport system ATP-binding protein
VEAHLDELSVEMNSEALVAHELYRFFHVGEEEIKALRGVDLRLAGGEFAVLMGPSGSGKSTLLACLAGIDEPDGGSVVVMGHRITRRQEAEKTRLRLAYQGLMLQQTNLFAHLTVIENLRLASAIGGRATSSSHEELIAAVGLDDRRDALPGQLSGGERARAGLLVALARSPAILLLDEPTAEVDAETETAILDLLDLHRGRNGAILVATHNPSVAERADRVLTMKDGKILNG